MENFRLEFTKKYYSWGSRSLHSVMVKK